MLERRGEDFPVENAGLLASVIRNLRLIWRLVRDGRVPTWAKAVLVLAIAYLLFPLDFLPDYILGLGQLDDVTVLLLGIKLFLSLCPPAVIREHLRQVEAVDAEYTIIEDSAGDGNSRA